MKVIGLLFCLLMVREASAADTEFFHQPQAGISEIVPHVGYRTSTIRASAEGSSESNFNGIDRLGVRYAYGISQALALGFDLSYSKFRIASGPDLRGFEPLLVFVNVRNDTSLGQFDYGLTLSLALEKAAQLDPINRSYGDPLSDLPAGGIQVIPYVGWSLPAGPGTVGVRADYAVAKSNVPTDTSSGEITLKNGNHGSAQAFYEILASDCILGAALTFDYFDRVAIDFPALGLSTSLAPHSMIGAKFYAVLPYESWQFLPSLTWREKASNPDYDKTSDLHLNIAARFAF